MAATELRVVGLDLSLTSTGMSDGYVHTVIQTPADWPIEHRLDEIMRRALWFVQSPIAAAHHPADMVVIEAGAFSRGAQSSAAEYLSALRLIVRHRLWVGGVPFAMVTPTGLKAYTAGNGRASKAEMVTAVDARHGINFAAVKAKDGRYDQADAFALAAMGYAHIGQPLPTKGQPGPQTSLDAVSWPELLSDN